MPKEIEMKVIGIDRREVLGRLKELGARYIGDYRFKRLVATIDDRPGSMKYVRLRSDGKVHTLTLKQRGKKGTDPDEFEVKVSDFKEAARILSRIFVHLLYIESKREEYSLWSTQITIDKLPQIPHYIEIEGKSRRQILRVYRKLMTSGKPFGNVPSSAVYEHYGLDYKKVGNIVGTKLRRILE
ncbi:MAG: CYTH domain-containing protein [Candidatus Micrarchaeota archaeon]|nr:CYTH domain-containing protein [Candidatus Micrarchaeota archaeon]MDE1847336.1 CYTH domain-containing protein [Candidatus Micrarchaeota archaeon]MDE1863951.1 CYTH domain-containing protein [Candidatus Micrarchaeota archaeon]